MRKPQLLDTTRIHPESYTLAVKIALDAMDKGEAVNTDSGEDVEAVKVASLRELMKAPDQPLDALEDGLVDVSRGR